MHSLQSHFQNVRAYLTPLASSTTFRQTGQITVDEFLLAGDYLVDRFPTWEWSSGDEKALVKDWMDGGGKRQFLVSRGVSIASGSNEAAGSTLATGLVLDEEQLDDDWIATHTSTSSQVKDIRDIDGEDVKDEVEGMTRQIEETQLEEDQIPDLETIRDIDDEDDLAGGIVEPDDPGRLSAPSEPSNLISLRSYDLYITYDRYYRVSRLWLRPFQPASGSGSTAGIRRRTPLPPSSALLDIISDYAKKTVTIEQFPWSSSTSGLMASVHPCRHASTMKRILDVFAKRQEQTEAEPGSSLTKNKTALTSIDETMQGGLRVDQYLVVFLKFMASISTIDLDATASI